MSTRTRGLFRNGVLAVAAVAAVLTMTVQPVAAQSTDYRAERTADGRPDLNGIWQALGASHWDIEGHAARPGPVVEMAELH